VYTLAVDVTYTPAEYLWKLLPLLMAFGGVLGVVPLLVYLERKICAFIQDRVGPNRVALLGPDGLLPVLIGVGGKAPRLLAGLIQPLADAVKLFTKEDFMPVGADKFLFTVAPFFAMLPPLLAWLVIPIGAPATLPGMDHPMPLVAANLDVGVLWVLAVASLSAYGVALGGWASNNKFGLLGGVRATAQMISYEVALLIVIASLIMHYSEPGYNGLSLVDMVRQQAYVPGTEMARNAPWGWGIFHQPLAFVLFVICAFAENNRLPFDMPECEAELVGGYHTEYSSMKFGMFFQGEYIAMLSMGALTATFFLGGWHYPGFGWVSHWNANVAALLSLVAFGLKVLGFVVFEIWVRWTLPRLRYDQLMGMGWKILIPVALLNLVLTAVLSV